MNSIYWVRLKFLFIFSIGYENARTSDSLAKMYTGYIKDTRKFQAADIIMSDPDPFDVTFWITFLNRIRIQSLISRFRFLLISES